MSSPSTKKSVKDREPKSVQSKLEDKSDELREKRTQKLDDLRGCESESGTIRISYRKPAPKIKKADDSGELSDENRALLMSRMREYCDTLGKKYLESQVSMNQQIDATQFVMRTFRVDDKLYGRAKHYYRIVCDEKRNGKTRDTVHAFVDSLSGDVYKPNGRSPSKNPIHNLLNTESYDWVLAHCNSTGSELRQSYASRDWTDE